MTDFYGGSGALKGARADLGYLIDQYKETNLGEKSRYVADKITGVRNVNKAGRLTQMKESWWRTASNFSDQKFRRMPGEGVPKAPPGEIETMNVTPLSLGQESDWDEDWDVVRELMDQDDGGIQKVEESYGGQSFAKCLQSKEQVLLVEKIGAATTPFDTADETAANAWSDSANATPISDITDALLSYGGLYNSVVYEAKTDLYFKGIDELTTRYGGNIGAGILDGALRDDAWASFEVENVFVCHTGDLGAQAVLFYLDPSKDPTQGFCSLIKARIKKDGENPDGYRIRTRDIEDGYDRHGIHVDETADFAVSPSGGVRIDGLWT